MFSAHAERERTSLENDALTGGFCDCKIVLDSVLELENYLTATQAKEQDLDQDLDLVQHPDQDLDHSQVFLLGIF